MNSSRPGPNARCTLSMASTTCSATPSISSFVLFITLLTGGRWLVSKFEGEYAGAKFEGRGQYGYDANKGKYVGTWIDTISPGLTVLEGTYDSATKTMTYVGDGVGPDGKTKYNQKMVTKTKDDGSRVFTFYAKADKDEIKFIRLEPDALVKLDPVIRLFEGDFVGCLSDLAQESRNWCRLAWPRTPTTVQRQRRFGSLSQRRSPIIAVVTADVCSVQNRISSIGNGEWTIWTKRCSSGKQPQTEPLMTGSARGSERVCWPVCRSGSRQNRGRGGIF